MPGSSEQREQALRHPLVLGNHEARVNDDIDLLAEHISLTVPLRDIVLVTQGAATYELDTQRYRAQAGSTAMFLPGMRYRLESELASGLVYNLSHQLLARYLCDASRGRLNLEQALLHLQRPHAIDLTLPQLQPVLYGLKVLVRTIDSLGSHPARSEQGSDSQALLQLQEGLYALSTALLLPDCAGEALNSWQGLQPPFDPPSRQVRSPRG